MRLKVFAGLLAVSIGATMAHAQASPNMATYKSPRRGNCDIENYFPSIERARGFEGWVDLRFTVKVDGSVTNVETLTSVGGSTFPEIATKWIATCKYEPATRNGIAVEAQNYTERFVYRFSGDSPGATEEMGRRLRAAMDLMAEGKLDEAQEKLDIAERKSQYIYEYMHVIARRAALYLYQNKPDIAVRYLWQIGNSKTFFNEKEYGQYQRMMLGIELNLNLLRNAEGTVEGLKDFGKDEADARLMAAFEQLKATAASNEPLVIPGRIPAECTPAICGRAGDGWSYRPVRRTISLAAVDGQLDTISGHCEQKTFTAKAETNITWTIPASWGRCSISVKGKPGTTFTLYDEDVPPADPAAIDKKS